MFYIFHHTDADGYSSAAVVLTHLILTQQILSWDDSRVCLIEYNYTPCNTFLPITDIEFKENDSVFIVDLSVSTGTLSKFIEFTELLYRKKCKLTWIDHHKSSVDFSFNDLLNKRFEVYNFEKFIDTEYCAAYNCFNYLIRGKGFNLNLPEIIRVIDDYDCWKLKLNGTKEFIIGLSLYDRQSPKNSEWYHWITDRKDSLTIINECIKDGITVNEWLRIDDTNKFNLCAFETTLCGLSCCVVNTRRNSDIFRTGKQYDLLLSYVFDGKYFKYSLYSRNPNVYCNKIAEMFKGGGHKGASGFSTIKFIVSKDKNILYKLKDKLRARKYLKALKSIKEEDV